MRVKQMAAKVAEKFGIAKLASEAKTAEDYGRVIAEIEGAIADTNAQLARLEECRATALLDGADADAMHREILQAKERAATLRMNLDVAKTRREQAAAAEATADIEASAKRIRDEEIPGFERDLNDAFLAQRAVIKSAETVENRQKEIEAHNYAARAAGRPDLVYEPSQIRDRIREGLFDRSTLPPEPVRGGPVDPDLARRIRAFGNTLAEQKERTKLMARHGVTQQALASTETDEAFALRCQNYQAQVISKVQRDDPLRITGEEAIASIERTAFPQDAHSAERNRRRVDFISAKGPNGERLDAVRPIDGHGQPMVERAYTARAQEAMRVGSEVPRAD